MGKVSLEEFVMSTISHACHLPREDIGLGTPVLDTGIDSLNLTAIVAHIEMEYGCELQPEVVAGILEAELVSDLVDMIRGAVSEESLASV